MSRGDGLCVRCMALLAVVVVVVLALTHVWNPWPKVWSWIAEPGPLAPGVSWQQQLGGTAESVTVAGSTVVVGYHTQVEAYGLAAGTRLWTADADWSAVAGLDADAVVVTGKLLTRGYQVLDPLTGAVRRTDTAAVAVWTYADAILDASCPRTGSCRLTAWEPRAGTPLWTASVPGVGARLFADNPDLPRPRPVAGTEIDARVAGPAPLPGLVGIPAGRRLDLVDTAAGRLARVVDVDRRVRLAVAGDRLLTVTGTAADGTCYYAVTATDGRTGVPVWRADGLNLRTGAGADCAPDRDPAGGQDVVYGVDPTGRPEIVDAGDGRVLWHGSSRDQRVLAVDDRYALTRWGNTLQAHDLAGRRVGWTRPVGPRTQAALTPYAVILADPEAGTVVAARPSNGEVLAQVRTAVRVVAAGPAGLLLGGSRAMAYLPFAPAAG